MRKNTYFDVSRIVLSSMAFGLFFCLSTLSTQAATITVNTLADEPGTGPNCSLREAIISANFDSGFGGCPDGSGPSDDIVFSVTGTIQLTGSLPALVSNLNIINAAGPSSLTIRRNTASDYQIFFIPDGSSVITLSGLTLSNGSSPLGGGIQNGADLTVSNCIIKGNTATQFAGGGIYNGGILAVNNSTISGNTGLSGIGGAGIENAGTMTITDSTVSGNRMTAAVGLNCAGGVSSVSALPLAIVNSTITDNEAPVATTCASGVRRNSDGTITVANSIIAGGRNNAVSPDVSGDFISSGSNLVGSGDGSTGFNDSVNGDHVGTLASPLNPQLGPLQDNGGPTPTHALLDGSPAIDAGNNSLAVDPLTSTPLANDQRGDGFHRVMNNKVDIGAFEVQVESTSTPPTISGASVSVGQGMTSNFKVASVADNEDAVGVLTVSVNGGASASSNSVTVSNLSVDAQGNVTADVSATCTATNANFVLRVSDSTGLFAEAPLNVTVTKSGAPGITLNRSITLFPPNHWYVPITLREMVRSVSDDCDANLRRTVTIEKVTSDEPDDAHGDADGNTKHDMVILPGGSIVFLRAERSERLNGRVYNVIIKATDTSGNVTSASFKVFVPIHRRGTAIEDPVANTVFR